MPRNVLPPNDFASLAALEQDLRAFPARYQATATPLRWTFTRADLHRVLADAVTPTPRGRPHERVENTSP